MIVFFDLYGAHYNQGFINVVKAYEHLIGKEGEAISFKLGKNGELFNDGFIDRKNVGPNTVRLRLRIKYKNWLQANFKQGDNVKLEIVSPNSIILYAKGEEH